MLLSAKIREYALLFNAERFFEAHELLEEVWKSSSGMDRELLQGLIQVAAAMVHCQRGNRAGAAELLAKKNVLVLAELSQWNGIVTADLIREALDCLKSGSGYPQIKSVE